MKDIKVRNAGTEKWRQIQKDYPGTRYEEFKAWEEFIWTRWLSEKIKSVKRTQTRKTLKDNSPRKSESFRADQPATPIQPSKTHNRTLSLDFDETDSENDFDSSPQATRRRSRLSVGGSVLGSPKAAKRRRTEDIFVALMRDGYMKPERVIELARMVQAEQEMNLGSTEQPMELDTEMSTAPKAESHSVQARDNHPLSTSNEAEGNLSPDKSPQTRVVSEVPPSDQKKIGALATMALESSEPMEDVELAPNVIPQTAHVHTHSGRAEPASKGSQGDPTCNSTSPKSTKASGSHNPRRRRVVRSSSEDLPPSPSMNDGSGDKSNLESLALETEPEDQKGDEDNEYVEEEEESEDEEYVEEEESDEGDGDDGESEYEESEGEDEEDEKQKENQEEVEEAKEERILHPPSNLSFPSKTPSSRNKKCTTDVFWGEDVDLNDFYSQSAKKNELPIDFSGIAADGIPDSGVHLLHENAPNASQEATEEDALPVELNLYDSGISDDDLRRKL